MKVKIFSNYKKKLEDQKKISWLCKRWINIMAMRGKYNKLKQTFSLNNIKVVEYGFKADCLIVDGLTYKELVETVEAVEDSLGCFLALKKEGRSKVVQLDFIFKSPTEVEFDVLDIKDETKLAVGIYQSKKPIIIDMIKYPHLLIVGGTRSGKSCCMDHILTNLIANNPLEKMELYLAQVAKSDLVIYKNTKQTRAFADNLEKTLVMLEYLCDKIKERTELITPYRERGMVSNYKDYNKLKGLDNMSTCYVAFDEMSSIFDTKGDTKNIKSIKGEITKCCNEIAQIGASVGVFLICSLQRPTVDNMPSFLKAMCTITISFRQNNSKSSEIALGDSNAATKLLRREFAIKQIGQIDYGIVPLIYPKDVYSIVKNHNEKNKKDLFRNLEIANSNIPKKPGKTKREKLTFDNVKKKSREEILAENIAKIPNFVPYDPKNDILSKIKKGREQI